MLLAIALANNVLPVLGHREKQPETFDKASPLVLCCSSVNQRTGRLRTAGIVAGSERWLQEAVDLASER
jgi:hypothetical protein